MTRPTHSEIAQVVTALLQECKVKGAIQGVPTFRVENVVEFLSVALHGSTIEKKILEFAEEQWGEKTLEKLSIKGSEEMGEVCGAALRIEEGRGTIEHLIEELGDVQVVLCQFAVKLGTTSAVLRDAGFAKIRARAAAKAEEAPLEAGNGASEEPAKLQTLQTAPPMTPHERRKANKKAQTSLDL